MAGHTYPRFKSRRTRAADYDSQGMRVLRDAGRKYGPPLDAADPRTRGAPERPPHPYTDFVVMAVAEKRHARDWAWLAHTGAIWLDYLGVSRESIILACYPRSHPAHQRIAADRFNALFA